MAIFASTTTSGYSDPLKALSIKALEQRQRDMQAQQAQQAAQMFSPENTQTPIQGFGQLANVIGDRFQQNRADAALGANKQQLAQIMSGYDVEKGLPPAEMAKVAALSPDLHEKLLTQLAAARAQQAGFTHADKSQAEQFRLQQEGKKADEQRKLEAPTDLEIVKLDRAKQRGEIDQPTYDMMRKKLTQGSAAEQKFITDQKIESVNNQSALASLDTALSLIDHPDGILAGRNADWKTTAADRLPERLTGINEKTRENTQQFNQIMGGQALQLLTQMKGASSDKDVAINFKIANDPNATPDNKKAAIAILKQKLAGYLAVHNEALAGAGGTVPTLPGAGGGAPAVAGGGAAADPLEGKTATGANGEKIIRRGGKWVPNG